MSENSDRRLGRIEFDPSVGMAEADAADMFGGMRHRQTSALALYRAARESGSLVQIRQLTYRCELGCLLLDVFHTPIGLASLKPAFRHSPERNASTAEPARAELTADGERRWNESADVLLPDELEYWVNCDHLLDRPLTGRSVRADVSAYPKGRVVIVN